MDKNIIKQLDISFVDNYDDIKKYQDNFNLILSKLDLTEFKSYNEFCKDIRNIAILKLKEDQQKTDNFFSEVIGKTLREKIIKNKNYEKKLMNYFNDYTLINYLKKQ